MPSSDRTLTVLVGTLPIEDGQIPPPRVGVVGQFLLLFHEVTDDGPDATVFTHRVRAEPVGFNPPFWQTKLHGDGWQAMWSAPRPVVGEIEIRGTLIGDIWLSTQVGVRGLVTRARVVAETRDNSDPRVYSTIPGSQTLREVDVSPRFFDSGLVPAPNGSPTGWHPLVPGDPWICESGVLLDLDLDNVPRPPLRPAFRPRALAAHGDRVWVADDRLPTIVCHTTGDELVTWPGPILTSDGSRHRKLFADENGCWITGPDGIRRIDTMGTVELLSEDPVYDAASCGSVLAVVLEGKVLRLYNTNGDVSEIDTGDYTVHLMSASRSSFLLRLRSGQATRLARLRPTGELEVGTELIQPLNRFEAFGSSPETLVGDGTWWRVQPDLTLTVVPPNDPAAANDPAAPDDSALGRAVRRDMLTSKWFGDGMLWGVVRDPGRPERKLLVSADSDTFEDTRSVAIDEWPEHMAFQGQTLWWQGGGAVWKLAAEALLSERVHVGRAESDE